MKKLGKILAWTLIGIVAVAAVAITFTISWRPFIGPRARATTAQTIERTPERLARGKYLAESVSGCIECHTPHDWSSRESTVALGNLGAGGEIPMKGLPGRIFAPNITPDAETGAGSWTDDQLARAIREGVGHDGRALFNMMPYEHYRTMSDEDLASVIVYLRALPPVRHEVPKTEMIFPVKYLIRNVPQPVTEPVPAPDLSTPLKRGTYMSNIAGCTDCHTPQDDHGQKLAGLDWAGGFVLEGPWGSVASTNLTSDPSGIPYYDEKMFIDTIRAGSVRARVLNPIMPFAFYRGMTDQDLAAIFAFVHQLPPVKHRVDNTEPPTYCKIDKQMHGGGGQN
ncbi:MAG: c-type cytochrome [Candidatus Acidiferrales bacterium]